MSLIFISYRRADSDATTSRLDERLAALYGRRRVFRDVFSIRKGADFVEVINEALDASAVVLVVIGPGWLNAEKDGARRLEDPEDYVRQEVAISLEREGVLVLPVLVKHASMPEARSLPEPLKRLARRNAAQLRPDPDFDGDYQGICELLQERVPLPGDVEAGDRAHLISRHPTWRPPTHQAPFKFLSYYEIEDRDIFFGRDRATEQLLQRVLAHKATVLSAPSGAGKTSLINAGVLPQVVDLGHRYVRFRDYTADPVRLLREHLRQRDGLTVELAEDASLLEILAALSEGWKTRVVVVLDQFERLLLSTDRSTRSAFINQLRQCMATASRSAVSLLFGVRQDFLGRFYAELDPAIPTFQEESKLYNLRALSRQEAKQAILEPLNTVPNNKIGFDPAFVDEVLLPQLSDGERIQPAHLQIVCNQLFEQALATRAEEIATGQPVLIGERESEVLGTADDILGNYLDACVRRIANRDPDRALAARSILKLMIESVGTRRFVSARDLQQGIPDLAPEILAELTKQLLEARVLEVRPGKERLYSLAAESMVPTVRGWFDPRELERAKARETLRHGLSEEQRSGALLNAQQIEHIRAWLPGSELSQADRDLLEASEAAETARLAREAEAARRLQQARLVGTTIATFLTIVAVFLAILSSYSREQALVKAAEAEKASKSAEKARKFTELALAVGLMRPIGHNREALSEVELGALAEIASATSPDLRFHVLDRALASEKTALQLLRRAPYVVHAAVGVDPAVRKRVLDEAVFPRLERDSPRTIRLAASHVSVLLEDARPQACDNAHESLIAAVASDTDPGAPSAHVSRFAELARFMPSSSSRAAADDILSRCASLAEAGSGIGPDTRQRVVLDLLRCLSAVNEHLSKSQAAAAVHAIDFASRRSREDGAFLEETLRAVCENPSRADAACRAIVDSLAGMTYDAPLLESSVKCFQRLLAQQTPDSAEALAQHLVHGLVHAKAPGFMERGDSGPVFTALLTLFHDTTSRVSPEASNRIASRLTEAYPAARPSAKRALSLAFSSLVETVSPEHSAAFARLVFQPQVEEGFFTDVHLLALLDAADLGDVVRRMAEAGAKCIDRTCLESLLLAIANCPEPNRELAETQLAKPLVDLFLRETPSSAELIQTWFPRLCSRLGEVDRTSISDRLVDALLKEESPTQSAQLLREIPLPSKSATSLAARLLEGFPRSRLALSWRVDGVEALAPRITNPEDAASTIAAVTSMSLPAFSWKSPGPILGLARIHVELSDRAPVAPRKTICAKLLLGNLAAVAGWDPQRASELRELGRLLARDQESAVGSCLSLIDDCLFTHDPFPTEGEGWSALWVGVLEGFGDRLDEADRISLLERLLDKGTNPAANAHAWVLTLCALLHEGTTSELRLRLAERFVSLASRRSPLPLHVEPLLVLPAFSTLVKPVTGEQLQTLALAILQAAAQSSHAHSLLGPMFAAVSEHVDPAAQQVVADHLLERYASGKLSPTFLVVAGAALRPNREAEFLKHVREVRPPSVEFALAALKGFSDVLSRTRTESLADLLASHEWDDEGMYPLSMLSDGAILRVLTHRIKPYSFGAENAWELFETVGKLDRPRLHARLRSLLYEATRDPQQDMQGVLNCYRKLPKDEAHVQSMAIAVATRVLSMKEDTELQCNLMVSLADDLPPTKRRSLAADLVSRKLSNLTGREFSFLRLRGLRVTKVSPLASVAELVDSQAARRLAERVLLWLTRFRFVRADPHRSAFVSLLGALVGCLQESDAVLLLKHPLCVGEARRLTLRRLASEVKTSTYTGLWDSINRSPESWTSPAPN